MASIANDPAGKKRILWVNASGERKSIRLGKMSQRGAESIKYRVEQLLEAQLLKRPLEADLAKWVNDLEPRMAAKLGNAGLIPKRVEMKATTLGPFISQAG
jgi:hypothetical protein